MGIDRREQPYEEDYFPIFIRALKGKSVYIRVRDTNSIKEVKSLFGTKERMPMKEAVLYYQGKVLKDIDLISKYNNRRNSTVFISIRLRGGS